MDSGLIRFRECPGMTGAPDRSFRGAPLARSPGQQRPREWSSYGIGVHRGGQYFRRLSRRAWPAPQIQEELWALRTVRSLFGYWCSHR